MSVYDWDLLSDESIYYYCLGSSNIVVWHHGWDWTFEECSTDRVWMEDEEE